MAGFQVKPFVHNTETVSALVVVAAIAATSVVESLFFYWLFVPLIRNCRDRAYPKCPRYQWR